MNLTEEKISINLNGIRLNPLEQVLKNASTNEKYIILQNNTLQKENESLKQELRELKQQFQSIEDENERMEKGRIYMKGLLKNFVNIEENRIKIKDTLDKRNLHTKSDLVFYMYLSYIYLICISFAILIWLINIHAMLIIYIVSDFGCIVFIILIIERLQKESVQTECLVKVYYKNIEEVQKGQNYLYDFIDDI